MIDKDLLLSIIGNRKCLNLYSIVYHALFNCISFLCNDIG